MIGQYVYFIAKNKNKIEKVYLFYLVHIIDYERLKI